MIAARVFARDSFRCCRCGTEENLQIDHIVPRLYGGADEMTNLQTLCRSCNIRKGPARRESTEPAMTLIAFRADVDVLSSIDHLALQVQTSRSDLIRQLLAEGVEALSDKFDAEEKRAARQGRKR